jgi:hypothetical protein
MQTKCQAKLQEILSQTVEKIAETAAGISYRMSLNNILRGVSS